MFERVGQKGCPAPQTSSLTRASEHAPAYLTIRCQPTDTANLRDFPYGVSVRGGQTLCVRSGTKAINPEGVSHLSK